MYHKDLEVYKKSIKLVKDIYQITKNFPKEEQFGLISQMRRASISIPSNIAEGSARFSDKDTSKFIDIAQGSLAEIDTQLLIAKELEYITSEQYVVVSNNIQSVQALIVGFSKYLKSKSSE